MTGFGAPMAGGFGKAPAPAVGGFGAPPAAGGFGAPAAGGFGAAAAPAAGGFGKAPVAGGFGAAPAAGGFGTAAPGGFGAPPAAGGFGAPAAGGFGKAPAAAGGFGSFGPPAAGGFGKSVGGFGVAVAPPPAPTLLFQGITGPGYVAVNTPSWLSGVDTALITDDTVIGKAPAPLQQHLGILLEFGEAERNAKKQLDDLYRDMHSHANPKGLRALQKRLELLQLTGSANLAATPSSSATGKSTSSGKNAMASSLPAYGLEGLLVAVEHRDASLTDLQKQTRELESLVGEYQRTVVDRVVREGAEGLLDSRRNLQQQHRRRESYSPLLEQSLQRITSLIGTLDDTIQELAVAVALQPATAAARVISANDSTAASLLPSRTSSTAEGQQPYYDSSATFTAPNGSTNGSPTAEHATGLFGVGAAFAQRAHNYSSDPSSLHAGATATPPPDFRQILLHSNAAAQRDPVATVNEGLQETLQTFLSVGRRVAEVHARADLVRDHVARYYGQDEAESLFGRSDLGGGFGAAAASFEGDEAMALYGARNSMRHGTIGETLRGGVRGSRVHYGGGGSGGVGNGKKPLKMQYDPSKYTAQGNVGTAPATAAAAAPGGFGAPAAPAAGGFGAPAAAAPAPATAGFGAPPAAATGGFGAPAAPSGFGAAPAAAAPAAPALGGFGAPAPAAGAPPPAAAGAVGFGANVGTPAGQAMTSAATGLGATPAPVGFGAAATPGSAAQGQTPSVPTPSLPGFSPSPAGTIALGGTPSPAVNTPGENDERPRKKGR